MFNNTFNITTLLEKNLVRQSLKGKYHLRYNETELGSGLSRLVPHTKVQKRSCFFLIQGGLPELTSMTKKVYQAKTWSTIW